MKIPEGKYEITKDKTGCYNLKPLDEKVKQWRDLGTIEGFAIDMFSNIQPIRSASVKNKRNINIFKTKSQAQASNAVAQLTQLLANFNDSWIPDWSNDIKKYTIINNENELKIELSWNISRLLAFPSKGRADLFIKHYEGLIKEASPILFGVKL